MAEIFLSYSRVDRPTAQTIAQALEAEGFTVWWDKILRAGQTYDEVTETMLRESHVVVVLWSQTSVKSTWVRAEATQGQRNCVLVPAMIEDAERPIMFELVQTADLIGWNGDRSDERWAVFVDDLKRALEKPKPKGAAAADPAPQATQAAPPPTQPTAETSEAPAAVTRPAPAPQPAMTAAPSTPEKKSSSALPMILAGVAVLGIGGWFGLQALQGSEQSIESETQDVIAEPVCEICPEMVDLAAGSFTMGSPASEANRTGNEGPLREVTLPAFSISKTEVSWNQWQMCVDAGGCSAAQGQGEGSFPVTGVNWDDASAYANWLSRESGRSYRLPSESEWEFAARGGTETAYWWGANYPGQGVVSGSARDTAGLAENPFGVVGMLGNVREWVADCYVNNYTSAPINGDAVTTGDCSRPVVRGGSFKTGAAEHRAASRARYRRSTKDSALGFRVVAD